MHEPTENMDGMNEYLEAGLAQQSFQQEKSDKQDEFEDAELTQAYNQPATTLDSTTVEDVPQETATRTQEETVKTITHGSLTVDASVRKKIIHPHQIDYAPLGTKYVTHDTKAPVGVTKDQRPPKTSTIRSSDLFARSSTRHDYMSHGTGTLGGVGTTTQPQRNRSTIIHDQSKMHELDSLMNIMENQNQITETLIKPIYFTISQHSHL